MKVESTLSPISLSKEMVSNQLRQTGFFDADEYIKDWFFEGNSQLTIVIFREGEVSERIN